MVRDEGGVYGKVWFSCNKFITGVSMTLTNLHSDCMSIPFPGMGILLVYRYISFSLHLGI